MDGMDIFEQNKFLKRLVVFFVVLNLIYIGFSFWKSNQHDRCTNRPDEYRDVSAVLQNELSLSLGQVVKMKEMRSYYYEKEHALSVIMRAERDSMNQIMFNKETDSVLIKTLAQEISDNGYKMEILRYEQAQALKKMCTPEQLQKFEHLAIEIRDYFRPDNRPNSKPEDRP